MNYTYIYTLSDPDTLEVRYVGKTDNIKKRYTAHINKRLNNTHKEQWIHGLKIINKYPLIEILDIVDKNNWVFWEQYWISQMRQWGFNLTNIGIGGEGGNCTDETRKKISDSKKGKQPRLGSKWTTSQHVKMKRILSGKKQNMDTINKRVIKNTKYIDIEILRSLYYDEGLNFEEIGNRLNLSESKIYKSLRDNNLIKRKYKL
jgi:hypothetical protein